jgi:hypothetical protein
MGVAAVLLVGLASGAWRTVSVSLLTLPLALAGLGVAGFHVYLERTGVLECPPGLLGQGTGPQQSLGAFTMVTFLLLADALRFPMRLTGKGLGFLAALVAAGGCVYGLIVSGPALKPPPRRPYDPTKEPLKVCRPAYHQPHKQPSRPADGD